MLRIFFFDSKGEKEIILTERRGELHYKDDLGSFSQPGSTAGTAVALRLLVLAVLEHTGIQGWHDFSVLLRHSIGYTTF